MIMTFKMQFVGCEPGAKGGKGHPVSTISERSTYLLAGWILLYWWRAQEAAQSCSD